ncbi:non-ribosomal peptide synthetase [Streptomyces africanus]|uniref:non-ribosomal peptide synthetase n=1 Tax=Streptomyces africanus TaxID=231024 RepID=UPI0011813145|nr:amino acid adenylation domain-containing protein [Streptomyces africanus]
MNTGLEVGSESTAVSLFEHHAADRPNAVALESGGEHVGYGELNAWASHIARGLQDTGAGAVVGIMAHPGPDMVAATIAVLKTGAAYVPLDPCYPRDRLAFLVADSGITSILVQADLADAAAGLSVPVVAVPDRSGAGEAAHPPLPGTAGPDDLAYVIYTSGTTGNPKGVEVTHGNLANTLQVIREHSGYRAQDVGLLKYSFSFDSSVIEMFAPLTSGARLVIAAADERKDPFRLVELISTHKVTQLDSVPLLLAQILEVPGVAQSCASLRVVVSGGDVLRPEMVKRFFELLPDTSLQNHYGPTETTNDSTIWYVDAAQADEAVPIGFPVRNTFVYLLDEERKPVPPGSVGEIWIGGAGIARGYRNQPRLTAEHFLPDPFTDGSPRMYRTGDLGRFRDDGALEFQGRADRQLSMRGFRVEPEEIEAALMKDPTVGLAVVTAGASAADQRLVAYVTAAESEEAPDPAALRAHMKELLPAHLVPTHYVVLADLPLNANGKVDYRALPEPGGARPELRTAYVGASTEVQRQVVAVWQDVLNIERIGVRDNFFELGGHSILAIQVVGRLRDAFDGQLPMTAIFENPTPGQLATAIEERGRTRASRATDDTLRQVLEADAELGVHPVVTTAADLRRMREPEHILLTGAGDFIGAHLLAELLRRTSATVTCLIGEADERRARARLAASLHTCGIELSRPQDVSVIAGDLRLPRLGLGERRWEELANRIDVVFHHGATENLAQPYTALRAANVSGTREAIRFAALGKVKALHFTSTVSVMPWKAGPAERIWPELPVESPDGLDYGFAQSKWVAEQLVAGAQKAGIPATVLRIGRVVGAAASGRWPEDDLARMLVVGGAQLGAVPRRAVAEPWLTAETAVSAMCSIALGDEVFGRVFHVVDGTMVDFDLVAGWIRDHGFDAEVLPPGEWLARLAEQPGNAAFGLLGVLDEDDESTAGRGRDRNPFAQDNTQAVLGRPGPGRAVTGELIGRLLDSAVRNGELPQPAPTH